MEKSEGERKAGRISAVHSANYFLSSISLICDVETVAESPPYTWRTELCSAFQIATYAFGWKEVRLTSFSERFSDLSSDLAETTEFFLLSCILTVPKCVRLLENKSI